MHSGKNGSIFWLQALPGNCGNPDYTEVEFSGSANQGHGIAVDASGATYYTGAINVPADVYVVKMR